MEIKWLECRTCLGTFETEVDLFNLFRAWNIETEDSNKTIATDLARLTNIELSEMDNHSKLICQQCLMKLQDACKFTTMVQISDKKLKQRYIERNSPKADNNELTWPKPMQLQTNELHVKEEFISDDENNDMIANNILDFTDNCLKEVEIKLEPEEIAPTSMHIAINGSFTEDNYQNLGDCGLTNGGDEYYENDVDPIVKIEPPSEGEEIAESNISLECLLCSKLFKKMSGLKAHVIAEHSYKSVRRKTGGASPKKKHEDKFVCAICRRNFVTLTDLMVHETCHNKTVCYGCGKKCDSFKLLAQHRTRCKVSRSISKTPVKHKTLKDVIRPLKQESDIVTSSGSKSTEVSTVNTIEESMDVRQEIGSSIKDDKVEIKEEIEALTCSLCNEEFSDSYYLKIHEEIHHLNNPEMLKIKTELIDNLFADS